MTDATGQAQADSTGTTAAAPVAGSTNVQTTQSGPATEETFFDPTSISGKPELEQAYKQMQREFTKRMQGIKSHQQKIEQYDRFAADPVNTLKQLATQYGISIVPQDDKQPKDWNPNSWEDVMARAKQEVLKEMKPVFDEVKSLKKQNIESYLDSNHSDWRSYETQMVDLLKSHPSLVSDPDALYRLAVPQNVIEQRATKTAMQKLKEVSDGAQVSGSTNGKQVVSEPTGPYSFDQAIEVARKRLSSQGMKRPLN